MAYFDTRPISRATRPALWMWAMRLASRNWLSSFGGSADSASGFGLDRPPPYGEPPRGLCLFTVDTCRNLILKDIRFEGCAAGLDAQTRIVRIINHRRTNAFTTVTGCYLCRVPDQCVTHCHADNGRRSRGWTITGNTFEDIGQELQALTESPSTAVSPPVQRGLTTAATSPARA